MSKSSPARFLLHVATKNRPDVLAETLHAVAAQTWPPTFTLVIDNADKQTGDWSVTPDWVDSLNLGSTFAFVHGRGARSDATASETGLDSARAMGYDLAIKWDDDLVPEPGCFEKLVLELLFHPGTVAAGGVYPSPWGEAQNGSVAFVWQNGQPIPKVSDGQNAHLQFFCWKQPCPTLMPVRHLYSSYAYRTDKAALVGGWNTTYTKLAHRHETDMSLRLGQVGKLFVIAEAKASHKLSSKGGIRDIDKAMRESLWECDEELFQSRMRYLGIDPDLDRLP